MEANCCICRRINSLIAFLTVLTLLISVTPLKLFATGGGGSSSSSSSSSSGWSSSSSSSSSSGGNFCGTSANADIVIMIDQTGSVEAAALVQEKNAAKDLLDFFSTAGVKPRVAIGSFHVSSGSCAGGSNILPGGSLTDVYGDRNTSTGLYGVIDGISGTCGNTDINAAINAAQSHLAGSGGTGTNNIILISDGIANRPTSWPDFVGGENSGASCQTCNCPEGRDAGEFAAIDAKNASTATRIFAIHFVGGGSCSAGNNAIAATYMQNEIASSPSDYYEGDADLSGVFLAIASQIGCNDDNPCTVDSCDEQTNTCVNESDPAAQCDCAGVPGGNHIPDGNGVCCDPTFIDDCNVCEGLNRDKDKCGVCFGDDSTCADCLGIPNGPNVNDQFGGCCEPSAIDDCGVCNGGNEGKDDCGVCFGGNEAKDACGVCFGDGSSCADCLGVPNGTATYDQFENCCQPGEIDDCGRCNGGNEDKDNCGVCFGDNSTCADCAGTPGGEAVVDDCGVCDGNNASKDSCGICSGGDAAKDLCGVCFGDNTTCENVCQETIVTPTLFELDGLGLDYFQFVNQTVKAVRKASGNKNAFATQLEEAQTLYIVNWSLTWSVPEIVKTDCLIEEFCVQIDNAGTLAQYSVNHERFGEIASDAIALLKKLKGNTAQVKKFNKRNKKLQAKDEPLIASIPPVAEQCVTPDQQNA